jgi:hypothetical protein
MKNVRPMLLAICLGMLSRSAEFAAADVCPPTYFSVNGHQAFILLPSTTPAANVPWVWYTPTLVGLMPDASNEWVFQRLLDNGIAVAGIDVGESYGSPAGRAIYSEFYTYATTEAHLASKTVLLSQSRGGLMAYNWAVENTDKVGAIAGIYPVCDLRSYPGLTKAAPAYGMTASQLADHLSENNPIDRLAPLAQADIPIYHTHGDSDTIVPLDANSQVVYDRYTALGGQMTLVVVPGKGHEEVPDFFQSTQLLDFMISHADAIQTPEPSSAVLLGVGLFTLAVYMWRKRR